VYAEGSTFYSFKKVLTELGSPYSEMELASFMSCSKGNVLPIVIKTSNIIVK